jgi:hypothetical protein
MMKKGLIVVSMIAVTGFLLFGAVNSTLAKGDGPAASRSAASRAGKGDQGNGSQGQGPSGRVTPQTGLPGLPQSAELDANEQAALLRMREEEKLAHDVYMALSAQWGLPIFENISQSEQTHMDALKTLIERYGLVDPASNAAGVFSDQELQGLYTALVARGSQSLGEALKVGAAIEEIDILDLEKSLSQTDNADVRQVYTNLENGSYNHLRAFVSTLFQQTGETYTPQYLEAGTYAGIISSGPAGNRGGAGSGSGVRAGRP